MKAKEELIKLVLDNDFITAPRLRAEFRSLLDRVEIEAQAEFKNCNIPVVVWRSEQLKAYAEYLQTRPDFKERSNKDLAIDYCDSL